MKIVASKPGQPPVRLEKRTGDIYMVELDCSALISSKETIFGKIGISTNNSNITIPEAKTQQGNHIKFLVSGGPVNIPYADTLATFLVKTNKGSTLSIPVSIRCYSV